MATIIDVAKLAGVSAATVSRVLAGNYPVAEETKKRVHRAVETLHYRPNFVGQALRGKSSRTVFVVFTSMEASDPIMNGVQNVLGQHNLDAVFMQRRKGGDDRVYDLIRSIPFYGIINLEMDPDERQYAELRKQGPVVQFAAANDKGSADRFVEVDNGGMTYRMASLLFRNGAKRLAYTVTQGPADEEYSFLKKRIDGIERAARDAGIPQDALLPYRFGIQVEELSREGYREGEAMARWCLAQPERPDAVLSFWDPIAVGCVRELQRLGVRVPEDCMVAGFEGRDVAVETTPAITTFNRSYYKLGEDLAYSLMAIHDSEAYPDMIQLECAIVERASTNRA